MTYRTWHLVTLGALALIAAAPAAQTACEPPLPGLSGSIPADGSTYPGNAAVLFQGYGVSLLGASVSVDGQPAALKDASVILPPGLDVAAATIDPPPMAGQSVVISGTFCDGASGCPFKTIQYQATAPDLTPPPSISLVGFNLHDYVDFKSSGGDCQSDSDFAWWVEIATAPLDAVESQRMYSIEAFTDASLSTAAFVKSGLIDKTGNAVVGIRGLGGKLEGKPLPEARCFRVRALDAAGNAASTSTEVVCKPCFYRVDGAPSTDFGPPPEPAWTANDVFASGPCDSSMSGAGGLADAGAAGGAGGAGGAGFANDAVAFSDCSCRIPRERRQGAPRGAALVALAAVMLARAARRGAPGRVRGWPGSRSGCPRG